MSDTSEEYYCKRDEFLRYVIEQVNPARKAAGLNEINQNDALVCYRIISDFAKKWGEPAL